MIELAVVIFFSALAAAIVILVAARAGRKADRDTVDRQDELEALGRIHQRQQP
jgi:hypothetical protein